MMHTSAGLALQSTTRERITRSREPAKRQSGAQAIAPRASISQLALALAWQGSRLALARETIASLRVPAGIDVVHLTSRPRHC